MGVRVPLSAPVNSEICGGFSAHSLVSKTFLYEMPVPVDGNGTIVIFCFEKWLVPVKRRSFTNPRPLILPNVVIRKEVARST